MKKMDFSLLEIKKMPENSPECDVNTQEFCNLLKELSLKYNLLGKTQKFINNIQKIAKGELWRKDKILGCFFLTEEFENMFFLNLLGEVDKGTILTKYTDTEGLKRICSDNAQSMTSLIGMNDSKECTYATHYMESKGYKNILTPSDDAFIGISSFITSFTTKKDDLTMWRLYGDDAKGVAIHYKVEDLPQNFYLAPVSYADENSNHPELQLLVEMTNITLDNCKLCFRHLYKWRYFFKSYEYNIENEIRLLYISDKLAKKSKWINTGAGIITPLICFPIVDEGDSYQPDTIIYPLNIVGTTLGPQFPEQNKNIETITRMFKTRFGWTKRHFEIRTSYIKNYKNI